MEAYNALMETRTPDCLDAIEHLPEGSTLVIHQFSWDEYEILVEVLDRPKLRVTYDNGRLEIVSPSSRHEKYSLVIEALVRILAEELSLNVEGYGSTTWKKRSLKKGAEADACYYVKNAQRVRSKDRLDLNKDPAPDIVVEIDITNQSSSKFAIYAAFQVAEIWRYSRGVMRFFELTGDTYSEIPESQFFAGLIPTMLADALKHSDSEGQTPALQAFRKKWKQSRE
jgi:Uma2 family endonuclease